MNEHLETKDIPKDIANRSCKWQWLFWGYIITHYTVGVVGVVASVLAATQTCSDQKNPLFGIVSATCIAVLGFVQPDKQYRKYVAAWRMLDRGIQQYRHGLLDVKGLLAFLQRGEQLIAQHEENEVSRAPNEYDEGKSQPKDKQPT